jgi:hypothetical protein
MSDPLLTFDAAQHAYTLVGTPVRSVTQILHRVGLVNFDDVPPSILEAARARGTAVHQAIHYFNEHDLDVLDFAETFPAYAGYVQSWIRLMDSGRLRTVLCEHRVASLRPRYAGTLDWIGTLDGEAALIDFATGHPEDVCKHLQTAAYVLAATTWADCADESALRAFIRAHPFIVRYAARLDRRGGLPQLTPYRDPRDLSAFLLLAQAVNLVDAERPKAQPWQWEQDAA